MSSEKGLKDCSLAQWWLKETSACKYFRGGSSRKRGFFCFILFQRVEKNCMKGQAKSVPESALDHEVRGTTMRLCPNILTKGMSYDWGSISLEIRIHENIPLSFYSCIWHIFISPLLFKKRIFFFLPKYRWPFWIFLFHNEIFFLKWGNYYHGGSSTMIVYLRSELLIHWNILAIVVFQSLKGV